MWDPPRPGIKPVSPALAGIFLTTGPPGKSLTGIYLSVIFPQLLSFPRSAYLFIFFWFHMNRTGFPEHYPFAGSVGTMPFNNGPSSVWDDRNARICSQEGSSNVILLMHTLCSFAKCPKDLFSLHCDSQLSLIIKKIQRQVLKLKELNSTQTAHFVQRTKNYFPIPKLCQALL